MGDTGVRLASGDAMSAYDTVERTVDYWKAKRMKLLVEGP